MVVSAVAEKIRSQGYWEVSIRPETFLESRIEFSELDEIIESAVVRMRGWPVPFIERGADLMRGQHWIGQDIEAEVVGHFECWRFYTSGQFSHLRAVGADWRHTAQIAPTPRRESEVIEVWEILFYLTEIFELAARLALSAAGDDAMTIDVALVGLENRNLIVGQRNRAEFFEPHRTHADAIRQNQRFSRENLVSDPRGLAIGMALGYFARFGWKPTREQLVEHQRELTDRP